MTLIFDDPADSLAAGIAALPAVLDSVVASGKLPPEMKIDIDPTLIPKPAELAKYLFPNTMAVAVDAKGMRVVTRDSFPSVTSSTAVGAVGIALLLPAVQAAREAARRAQCVNNEKQIMLAMHNYESANGTFPARAIVDKAGKPLLSWRVAILPFIECQELYNKFHLDEAWDSPHNKPLIAEMPQTFRCPSHPTLDPTFTSYQVYAGPGTFLETSRGVKLAEITDGTAMTLGLIESKEGVPWTKPDDLPFTPDGPFTLPSSRHPGGFNASMVDGSVRFIKSVTDPATLRKMVTRAGGERIDAAP